MTEQLMPQNNHFDAAALLTIKERVSTFQKLDLAYIAAGGAVVTAFKLSSSDVIEITAQFWIVVVAVLVLLVYDTILEKVVFLDWIASQQQSDKRLSSKALVKAISVQPLIHLTFICCLMTFGVGYAQGSNNSMRIFKGEAAIQDAVENFLVKEKRLPLSIAELESKYPNTKEYVDLIGLSEIRIEHSTDALEKYHLTFPGRDRKIDTSDDEMITATNDLTKIYDEIRSRKKTD
jgi:hypothetical protein